MAVDEIISVEEDILSEYTAPSEIGPDGLDSASNISNLTKDLPRELSSEVPSQLTGEGAQSTLTSIIDYLNSALGIDLVSISGIFLRILIIIFITHFIVRLINRLAAYDIPLVDLETQKTFRILIRRVLVVGVYVIGVLLVLNQIHLNITLLAGVSVIGITIGFAAQSTVSNIISGMFLAVFQPFKLGDYVEFKGEGGHIEDITLRHTVISTWDGRHIFVPNNIMNNESITNWTIINSDSIWPIEVKISYKADVEKARRIMLEVAESHPNVIDIQDMAVKVPEIGNSAVKMRLLIGVGSNDVIYATGSEIRETIKGNFEEEGIEML